MSSFSETQTLLSGWRKRRLLCFQARYWRKFLVVHRSLFHRDSIRRRKITVVLGENARALQKLGFLSGRASGALGLRWLRSLRGPSGRQNAVARAVETRSRRRRRAGLSAWLSGRASWPRPEGINRLWATESSKGVWGEKGLLVLNELTDASVKPSWPPSGNRVRTDSLKPRWDWLF